jgi:single-stranded DNA-binding protein
VAKRLTRSHITVNINRIIITGNLVANPTLRETNAGTPVASATIAKNESLTRRYQDSVDLPVHPFSAAR